MFLFWGGEWNQRESSNQFVHKPGPGIPTSSTPYQQPALTMPQVGEGATSGPEALSGGGHTQNTKVQPFSEFSPLDWPCDISQLRAVHIQTTMYVYIYIYIYIYTQLSQLRSPKAQRESLDSLDRDLPWPRIPFRTYYCYYYYCYYY